MPCARVFRITVCAADHSRRVGGGGYVDNRVRACGLLQRLEKKEAKSLGVVKLKLTKTKRTPFQIMNGWIVHSSVLAMFTPQPPPHSLHRL